ncbi:DNA-binding transcriptional regulator, ArsR family [Thermomonospora echinospora]|uniref:DNA-binding transcriptional regulator, ArsR family n=1 Tax=Thermomonospora echinospora TaxID=1992 RepID=A0A1H6CV79_9ACTN|nr:metalloregulator ArsR/SmtB family transcription factor [Thermomonospora echinospora]SEG76892.1 DNA-binding transcriptional regulator, ArsR family [Thermomonospora echinospora]
MAQDDPLSVTFAALADPTRRAILARLAEGEATVGELAEPFDVSLPAISKHLKVLQRAGLVEQGRQAQWRPCRLRPQPLQEVAAWMAQYREFIGQSYDRLDDYLQELQQDREKEEGK